MKAITVFADRTQLYVNVKGKLFLYMP